MSELTIRGLPDNTLIMQGYFVWSGVDEEGRKVSGGIEYPLNLDDEPDNHDYDGYKTIGMLTVARQMLIESELSGHEAE